MRAYITRNIHAAAEEALRQAGCEVVVNPDPRPLTAEELREAALRFDGLITLLSDKVNAELLAIPGCAGVFANYAVGFDNLDVAAATRAGIALCNTPDVLTAATAEMAWALLFAAARHICEGDRIVRQGRFHGWEPLMLLGHEAAGRTLGIVGAGRIGAAMARRARGFEMPILYTSQRGSTPAMEEMGARQTTLDVLLRESDFVSIHTPLTPQTRHLIGEAQLRQMKSSAVLVNTARGPVVDEKALVRALQEGWIAAAGLDVYEREPAVEPELLTLPNVALAPHLGSATFNARRSMAELAARNLLDFFDGRVPRTCINPEYINAAKRSGEEP